MDLMKIKKFPDRILKQRCVSVCEVTHEDVSVLNNMVLTMHHFKGIGLAAPQVGILKRFIVADIGEGVIKMVNPELIKKKGADKMEEGCLSIPDVQVEINRYYEIIVNGVSERNQKIEIKANGLLARVIQHEIDHLNGRLIIDHLNIIEKMKILCSIKNHEQEKHECKNII